jgi:4-hydroxy-4-methyl-2-oxoglutarate aldolase
MDNFDLNYRSRFMKLATTNVADALDALNIKGATFGITPIWEGAPKIVGQAVTVKILPAGMTKPENHYGVGVIEAAKEGDVIVFDNGGRLDTTCLGGILATAAWQKKVAGAVIDGACRDIEEFIELGFPVYARVRVITSARGRSMDVVNVMIQFGGVQVRPHDIVFADCNGVVVIPQKSIEEVLAKAEAICDKDQQIVRDIKSGMSILEVFQAR